MPEPTPKTRAMIQVSPMAHKWLKSAAGKHKVGISELTEIILSEGRRRIRSGELKIVGGPTIQTKTKP